MKKIHTYARRGLGLLVAGVFALSSIWMGGAMPVRAAETYYEEKESVSLGGGVTYETRKMVTSGGLLDVYILRVPLTDPNIQLTPVFSEKELNLREGTTALVNGADNAVAGVNGDFFTSQGKYGMPVGLTADEDGRISGSTFTNAEKRTYATFILDENNAPMIEYIRTYTTFNHGGVVDMPIAYYNQLINFSNPVYIDSNVMTDTAQLDAREPNLMKLVIEDGTLTRIVPKGETVRVPENGFLIVLTEKSYEFYKATIAEGQTAQMTIQTSIDIDRINMAISGAGKILVDGKMVSDGHIATGRHPRTAIGVTQDGKQAILMVVDGRTHSIGATHAEMADLLLREGAYNAMHLDGGGSSTMVVQEPDEAKASVVNRLSDGSERAVANALAVLNEGPVGEATSLVIKPAMDAVLKSHPMKIEVYGLDAYAHRINIPIENVQFIVPEGATVQNGMFTAQNGGVFNVQASYNGMTAQAAIRSTSLATLKYTGAALSLAAGAQQALSFTGTSRDGFAVAVNAAHVQYTVNPAALGVVENGVFRATGVGSGWVQCTVDGVTTYIPVRMNAVSALGFDFMNGATPVTFMSQPTTVEGTAIYRTAPEVPNGDIALELTYLFEPSTTTQAAYANFGTALKSSADGYRISVYGTGSGHWIRGRVLDADGKEHLITFTQNADFVGWRDLDAMVPAGAKQPLVLERIYVASLSETEHSVYRLLINDLRILKNASTTAAPTLPADVSAGDDLRVAFQDTKPAADVTFIGKLWHTGGTHTLTDYAAQRKKAMSAFLRGSSAGVYAGAADLRPETNGANIRSNTGAYKMEQIGGMTLIMMNSAGGGFSAANLKQWAQIEKDLQAAGSVVAIQTDISPLNFKLPQEGALFHALLKKYAAGRTIFVVSASGLETTDTVKEGIRYINLGHMYNGSAINPAFSVLRLRVENGTVRYGLEKVW